MNPIRALWTNVKRTSCSFAAQQDDDDCGWGEVVRRGRGRLTASNPATMHLQKEPSYS
jgi:hypothetical protein